MRISDWSSDVCSSDLADPAERLIAIRNCMNYNKKKIHQLTPAQLTTYAALMLAPGALGTFLGLMPDKTLGKVVISHVAGSREPMRSEEHASGLQSLIRLPSAVMCCKKTHSSQ